MDTQPNQVPRNTEKLKEIPKWTRKYAQNRTLTILVLIVMTCLVSLAIGVPVLLVGIAFVKGNMILAGVGIALLVAILIFLTSISNYWNTAFVEYFVSEILICLCFLQFLSVIVCIITVQQFDSPMQPICQPVLWRIILYVFRVDKWYQ